VSNKTITTGGERGGNTYGTVKRAIQDFAASLPKALQRKSCTKWLKTQEKPTEADSHVGDDTIKLWRKHVVDTIMAEKRTQRDTREYDERQEVTGDTNLAKAQREAKRHLQHLVISEIDKARGELFICCPTVTQWTMEAAWPQDPGVCTVMHDKTERAVLLEMSREHKRHDWDRIGGLYGCDKAGNITTAKLPRCYATIKDKCIPEDGIIKKLKARPISPHTRVPWKRVMNKVATAYLFVLQQVRDQRQMRLWTTQELVPRAWTEKDKVEESYGKPLRELHEM
jgi:hypothetical protein